MKDYSQEILVKYNEWSFIQNPFTLKIKETNKCIRQWRIKHDTLFNIYCKQIFMCFNKRLK